MLYANGYAVIVGVGGDLPVTKDDAGAVAQLLRDPARCAYVPDQVQLLTGEGARRDQILAALDVLAEQTRRDQDATAIVYFSGHGLELPDYYLLPFGYNLRDLAATAIPGDLFTAKLRAIVARRLLVVLDCCHAGGQAEAKGQGATPLPLPAAAIETLRQHSGRVVLASSRKDELSYTARPYSIFTTALLEGLAGYGSFERDGYARVLDLALYIGREVPNRTSDLQHPIIKVKNLEDNFALAYYAAGDAHPKRLEWSPTAAAPATSAAQRASWQRRLASRRSALLLLEERMSEYIEYQSIPLQLVKNYRETQHEIATLEQKLGVLPE